jgi:hypothetical protein
MTATSPQGSLPGAYLIGDSGLLADYTLMLLPSDPREFHVRIIATSEDRSAEWLQGTG